MSRFIGQGKHYTHPRSEAHQRANNAGGLSADESESGIGAAHAALFAGAVVKLATVTAAVTAASYIGAEPGTGAATIYSLTTPDGETPVFESLASQTVRNPFTDSFAIGSTIVVVYTGQFYVIVLPPITADVVTNVLSGILPATLISILVPTPPPVVGSRASGAALLALLTVLDTIGFIDDQTTA